MRTRIAAAAVGLFAGCALALAAVPASAENGGSPGGGVFAPLEHEWTVAPLDHEGNFAPTADNGTPGGGVTPAGDDIWPKGSGDAPASTDGYRDAGWSPDYPINETVGALGDDFWPKGSG